MIYNELSELPKLDGHEYEIKCEAIRHNNIKIIFHTA